MISQTHFGLKKIIGTKSFFFRNKILVGHFG